MIAATAAFAVLAASGLAGCGGGIPMADVRGQVKLDGVPIESGSIAFKPADGIGPSAGGMIERGEYSVRVPPGKKRVEIIASRVVGKSTPTPDNPTPEDIFEQYIPPNYNADSTLSEEIELRDTVLDFELKKP